METSPAAISTIPSAIDTGVPSRRTHLADSPVKLSSTTDSASGAVRSPASSGPYPSTNCRCWVSRNSAPPIPKVMSTAPATAPVNLRSRKKWRSSIGSSTRLSQYANSASTTTATAAVPSTRGEVQP